MFGFLLTAAIVACGFGFIMYWLLQPTVLQSKANVSSPLRPTAFVLVPPSDFEDRDRASMALAKKENEDQGLKPLEVAHDTEELESALPAKEKKRVAKAIKRERPPRREAGHTWAYARPTGSVLPLLADSGDGGQAFHLKADSESGRSRTAFR